MRICKSVRCNTFKIVIFPSQCVQTTTSSNVRHVTSCNASMFISLCFVQSLNICTYSTLNTHYAQYFNLTSLHPLHISAAIRPINPLTDTRYKSRQTPVPSAVRSTDCVDIASGSVLPVAQWTRYVHLVSGSAQTVRTSGKCRFVRGFMVCAVHQILLKLPNEGEVDG